MSSDSGSQCFEYCKRALGSQSQNLPHHPKIQLYCFNSYINYRAWRNTPFISFDKDPHNQRSGQEQSCSAGQAYRSITLGSNHHVTALHKLLFTNLNPCQQSSPHPPHHFRKPVKPHDFQLRVNLFSAKNIWQCLQIGEVATVASSKTVNGLVWKGQAHKTQCSGLPESLCHLTKSQINT